MDVREAVGVAILGSLKKAQEPSETGSMSTPGRAVAATNSAAAVAGAWVAGRATNQLAMAIKRPTALVCGTYLSHKDLRPKDLQAHSKGKCGGYFWQGGGHRLPGTMCVWLSHNWSDAV